MFFFYLLSIFFFFLKEETKKIIQLVMPSPNRCSIAFFWRERGEKLYKTSRKRAKQSCRSFIFSPALPQLLSLYITMAKEDDGPSYTFHPSNERLYCGTRVQVCFSNPFECPSKSFMVVRVCVWGGCCIMFVQ